MIDELQLFRGRDYKINDYITIHQPTLNEICDYGEKRYWNIVSTLTATPADYKVILYDNFNMDYEKVDEFDFFCMLSKQLSVDDTYLFFGNQIDLSKFIAGIHKLNNDSVFYEESTGRIIDKLAFTQITDYLRKVHGFKKNCDVAYNEATKMFVLDAERREAERNKNKKFKSTLIPLISALTNCEQFKYSHSTVWDLPIYAFMDSVKRIQVVKEHSNLMQGVYSGCVDFKKINKSELDWMRSLD